MASSNDRARSDGPQRWGSILVGAALVALVGWMTLEAKPSRPAKQEAPVATSASASAEPAPADATDAGAPVVELDLDAGLVLPTLSLDDAGALPTSAPRSVKLGVVLVAFAGAEGAPPTARSKKDAQAIAERLGADARSDFHRAVSAGDPGSADDIGRIPRGVLDPRTELAVFALSSGDVSDVLETPRGFWIVKRID